MRRRDPAESARAVFSGGYCCPESATGNVANLLDGEAPISAKALLLHPGQIHLAGAFHRRCVR